MIAMTTTNDSLHGNESNSSSNQNNGMDTMSSEIVENDDTDDKVNITSANNNVSTYAASASTVDSYNFGSNGPSTTLHFSGGRRRSHPLPSGLSALLQAATSQLGHLADVACSRASVDLLPEVEYSRTYSEDTTTCAVSSESERSSQLLLNQGTIHYQQQQSQSQHNQYDLIQHAQEKVEVEKTPPIVPEPQPRQYSFPEILMTLALDPANVDVITFLPDGKFFAVRSRKFAEDLMIENFNPPIQTFDEFLEIIHDWGFSTILDPASTGIAVFRHPNFRKGDWVKCTFIKVEELPTNLRLHALPDRNRVEFSRSDDSNASKMQHNKLHITHNSSNVTVAPSHEHPAQQVHDTGSPVHTKRRLSPGFLARRDSASSVSSQKQKVNSAPTTSDDPLLSSTISQNLAAPSVFARPSRFDSGDESEVGTGDETIAAPTGSASYCNPHSHADDVRSLALSLTTEKLNIRQDGSKKLPRNTDLYNENEEESISDTETPLIDRAVTSATHTIVSDAIESLLRDETHTKETYLKHEKELSVSSLPGVISISKQLFSPNAANRGSIAKLPQRNEVEGYHNLSTTSQSKNGPLPSEVFFPSNNHSNDSNENPTVETQCEQQTFEVAHDLSEKKQAKTVRMIVPTNALNSSSVSYSNGLDLQESGPIQEKEDRSQTHTISSVSSQSDQPIT